MSASSEISALIRLLDDEDPEVFQNVSERIVSYGKPILKDLEHAWDESLDSVVSSRIENLMQVIQFESVKKELSVWVNDEFANLSDGAFILASYHFPNYKKEEYESQLNKVKQKIWLELNSNYDTLQNISLFNHVFYNVLGFHGDYNNKMNTKDFFVNSVLETKYGNSISLGILYIILAQQLELPVYGVNLFRHFVLAVNQHFIFDFSHVNEHDVLSYLNPINKGIRFSKNDILKYLKASNIEAQKTYFLPSTPQQVIKELLYYLKFHFISKNDEVKSTQMDELAALIP